VSESKLDDGVMNHGHSLAVDEVTALDMYWQAANYLGTAQIYLRDNCLLEKPLEADHIKRRLNSATDIANFKIPFVRCIILYV
jgi:phosphoketolase